MAPPGPQGPLDPGEAPGPRCPGTPPPVGRWRAPLGSTHGWPRYRPPDPRRPVVAPPRGGGGCLRLSPSRGRRLAARRGGGGPAWRRGCATGTVVPSLGRCGRPPACPLHGRRRAPRATPGAPPSPRWCRTCLRTRGIWWALWPPSPGGVPPTCGWSSPVPGRRVDWLVGPCAAPRCGRGLTRRVPAPQRAQVGGRGRRRAARPPVATPTRV